MRQSFLTSKGGCNSEGYASSETAGPSTVKQRWSKALSSCPTLSKKTKTGTSSFNYEKKLRREAKKDTSSKDADAQGERVR